MTTYGSGRYGGSTYGPPLPPSLPGKPLLATLYTFQGVFIKSLGPILNRPKLKWTLNAGGHPIEILLPAQDTSASAPVPGNLVKLREDGGDGTVLYTGIVQDVPDDLDVTVRHALTLDPLVVETGYTPFTRNYSAPTDIGQMVRDAVSQTDHLTWTATSVPLAGLTATNNFQYKWVLDVLNFARTVGGPNWFWFVDATGLVWFQQVDLTRATHTFLRGQHYDLRKASSSNASRRNYIVVKGMTPPGGSAPLTSVYSGASRATIGTRAAQQIYSFPTVSDQGTLNALANTIGAAFDRQLNRIQFRVNKANLSAPLVLGRVGGATVRYSEIQSSPLQESSASSGAYRGPFAVIDVEDDGENLTVIAADIPVSGIEDFRGELDRIMQATVLSDLTYTPAALNVPGVLNGGGLATASDTGNPARWKLDGAAFRAFDGTSSDYGLPDGAGETVRIGSDGVAWLARLLLQSAKTGGRLVLDTRAAPASLQAYDGTSTDYGLPDGPGETVRFGSDGVAWISKLLLQSAKTGGRIVIDSKSDPQHPVITVYDPNGVARFQLGSLAAYTDPNGFTSPATFGGRQLDAAGNLISDTTYGPVNALPSLGISTAGPGQTITSSSFVTTSPAISITFTLNRKSRCMFYFFVTAKSNFAGYVAYARLNIVGVGTSGNFKFGGGVDVTNAFGHVFCGETSTIGALAPGTYTACVEAAVDAGGSMYFDQGYVQGFVIGQ